MARAEPISAPAELGGGTRTRYLHAMPRLAVRLAIPCFTLLAPLLPACDSDSGLDRSNQPTVPPAHDGGSASPASGVDASPAATAGDTSLPGTAVVPAAPVVAAPRDAAPAADVNPIAMPTADAGRAQDASDDAASETGAGGSLPPVKDLAQAGPYGSAVLMNVGPSNNYAVYMPMMPLPGGVRSPLVGWVSGGATTHDWYTLLPHLASHGFTVITSNTSPSIGAEVELGREMIAGIDWVSAESARQGSQLFGKVDVTKIAASGYSMGSLATFTIAADPRLTTTVHISGGNMGADALRNLRAPAAFICGTPDPNCTPLDILSDSCDIAAANCDTDFAAATTSVFYANFPGGHLGVMTTPHQERIAAMVVAWLRLHLTGDTSQKRLFVGSACGYCSDTNWKVQQKKLE